MTLIVFKQCTSTNIFFCISNNKKIIVKIKNIHTYFPQSNILKLSVMDSPQDEMHHDIVCTTLESECFDEVVGHIEDIVLSEEFQKMQVSFLEKYWRQFDYSEENKLEYMDVFEEYTNKFEIYLMDELRERMENFDMGKFAEELNSYDTTEDSHGFGGSEIFELLQSFNNFETFKELILDYRSKKEGHLQHLDFDILITTPLR